MTTKREKRHDALVALRKRDRAEALLRLDEALYDSETAATALKSNRERIDELQIRLRTPISSPVIKASRLAGRVAATRLARSALKKQRQAEAVLISASEEMSVKLDVAKDEAVKSIKALQVLEDSDI